MNFLGHSYLCIENEHLIAGNLAGDSYKGSLTKINHLPKHIRDGVKFHRFIDNFTDQSNQIKEVAHIFQANGISKVAFIACDILIDHYLAKNWNQYSVCEYEQFIYKIYSEVDDNIQFLETDFLFLYERMKEYGWFFQYRDENRIEIILLQFSNRLPFENDLGKCMKVFLENIKVIESLFKTFLNDIRIASDQFTLDNKLNIL